MKKKYLSLFICTLILISSVGFSYSQSTTSTKSSTTANSFTGIWDLKDVSKIMPGGRYDRMLVFYPNMSFNLTTDGAKLGTKGTSFRGTYTFTEDKLTLNYKDGTKIVKRTLTYDTLDAKTLRFVAVSGTKKTYTVYNKFVR